MPDYIEAFLAAVRAESTDIQHLSHCVTLLEQVVSGLSQVSADARNTIGSDLRSAARAIPRTNIKRAYLLPSLALPVFYDQCSWDRDSHSDKVTLRNQARVEITNLLQLSEWAENDTYLYIIKGILSYTEGDMTSALHSFAKCSHDQNFRFLVRDYYRGAWTLKPIIDHDLDTIDVDHVLGVSDSNIRFINIGSANISFNYCLVFAGDERYFRAFSRILCSSLSEQKSSIRVHFHIVEQEISEAVDSMIRSITLAFSDYLTVSFSRELTTTTDKAYFSSVRFLILPYLLARLRLPLFIFDMDILFSESSEIELKALASDSVRHIKNDFLPNLFIPWRRCTASFLFIPNSNVGLKFAKLLRSFVILLWNKTRAENWWIDQSALELTRLKLLNSDIAEFVKPIQFSSLKFLKSGAQVKWGPLQEFDEHEKQ